MLAYVLYRIPLLIGDPDKWLEYIVATNEWYVKPTADRGRPEGWMCLASDPPTRPELCRGTCEVWDGDKWIVQGSVTVLTAVSAFESMLEIQIFCADEIRCLQKKLDASFKRAVELLLIPIDKTEDGYQQMNEIITELDDKIILLQSQKLREDQAKRHPPEMDTASPPAPVTLALDDGVCD
jgi:hypothetical protein